MTESRRSRGERLAAWLEELGLARHLVDAGLPTFERDVMGDVHWTDPHTGDPLTGDQLAQLDELLHSDGSDPAHAVPVALVQIARRARVRETLLASDCHTYESLAALRDTSVDAARFLIHKAERSHLLLVVTRDGEAVVPAFQLTDEGEPRVELMPMLAPLLSAGTDPWDVWTWLTQPAALLGGLIPHEAAADPDTAGLAHHAAIRLAERAADGPPGPRPTS